MNKQQVWRKIHESFSPQASKKKCFFKIRCNVVYQAGLVAWGYSQVPGIKLVVNDITFLILLLVVIHFGYLAKIVDVETAFLYGNLEEEIYMECPQGMSNMGKDGCIILNKCIYGLVQAAQQYYKKAVEILKSSGFVGGSSTHASTLIRA